MLNTHFFEIFGVDTRFTIFTLCRDAESASNALAKYTARGGPGRAEESYGAATVGTHV